MVKEKTKQSSLSSWLLYPKEKWGVKRGLLTALIILLTLNILAILSLPFSDIDVELTVSQMVFAVVIYAIIILLLLPKFNVWLDKKYKISFSKGVKSLIIFTLILLSAYL